VDWSALPKVAVNISLLVSREVCNAIIVNYLLCSTFHVLKSAITIPRIYPT
jgi:hypothetical protein